MGYLLSIWVTLVAVTLNATLFAYPKEVSWWLLMYPTFPFVRFLYFLTVSCGYEVCISSWSMLDNEAVWCMILPYIEGVVFLILALYLNQVVPQAYGIPKHPLFICREGCRKKKS